MLSERFSALLTDIENILTTAYLVIHKEEQNTFLDDWIRQLLVEATA